MLGRDNDVRVILLGNTGVGKTSFIRRLVGCGCVLDVPTIASTYFPLRTHVGNGRKQSVALWDTAGQERFRGLMPMYFRDCNVVLLMYDVHERLSFAGAEHWLRELRKHQSEPHTVVLLGNKTDLPGRQVAEEEGRAFAQRHHLFFCELSVLRCDARTVKRIFRQAVKDFVQKRDRRTAKDWVVYEMAPRPIVLVQKEPELCCAGYFLDLMF